MTNLGIRAVIAECIREKSLMRAYFAYSDESFYLFPLMLGDSWFLAAEENEFILNGYTVRRIADIDEAEVYDGKSLEILRLEGVTGQLAMPLVDMTRLETVFRSLAAMRVNVIVENEESGDEYDAFIIGRIEKVAKSCVYIRHFDAEGVWETKPRRIAYGDFTSITFGSRYVEVFSRYIGEPPEASEV